MSDRLEGEITSEVQKILPSEGFHWQQRPRTHAVNTSTVDRVALEADLKERIKGEVRFDTGSRALYSTDSSNYRQVPIGVVIPKDENDVIETLAAARRFGAPIVARGGGTSLAGQTCNVAIVLDFSKYMNRIVEIDPDKKIARIQPGVVLDWLRDAAEHYNLTFGPDPATHNHCTLGGMIGNNSCGVHALMAGKTDINIEELDILTYDGFRMRVGKTSEEELQRIITGGGRRGEIYSRLKALRDKYGDQIRKRYPDIPRRVSGYNLPFLLPEHGFDVAKALVGSECTCVVVLEATTRLVYSPPARTLLVLGYPSIYVAGDHIPEILKSKPIGLEGIDDRLVNDMKRKGLHPNNIKLLPDGRGWLLVEFGGETKTESDEKAKALMETLRTRADAPSMKLYDSPEQERQVWIIRESGLGATAVVPGQPRTWEGWEDSAVPPDKVGPYLRDLRALFDKYDYDCSLYGHFGQGCIHTRIDFDLETAPGIAKYRAFMEDAVKLVLSYGGSLSGEHGDGQSRAEFLPQMFGEELIEAFNEFKSIWDPDWKMNPGKVVKPYKIDENLRLGVNYNPPVVKTHFKFPIDNNNFADATTRCVGVGECRRQTGGTMCPSYRATMEEMHSTRGRARLLFEMMQGDPLQDGWHSDHVREALDLCLACKGCLGDCPVQVDMATYKAEFLSHYYDNKLRPVSAYSMGLIYWWARLAAIAPGIVNFVAHAPVLGDIVKALGGIAPERQMPTFAGQTFKDWFKQREPRNLDKPKVILWADTFNNNFFPDTAKAAVEVLEDAGFQVVVPRQSLCCGRPLYDFGFLDLAEGLLKEILLTLSDEIAAGTPIVGLEPSCVAVFRDELVNLFPHIEDAKRLNQQVFLLSEFLAQKTGSYQLPRFKRKAIVHGHCHQKAIMGMQDEEEILRRMGMEFETLDDGCCGMAGSFGFEKSHYDISMKVGEHALLPAVRKAEKDTLIITDGFSCREQIDQTTERKTLHLAELIQLAKRTGEGGPAGDYPEQHARKEQESTAATAISMPAMIGAGALLAGGALWWLLRKRRQ